MHSSLIYADTRCALGGSLDEAVDNLLAGRKILHEQHFPDLEEAVTLPYYAIAGDGTTAPDQEQRIYRHLQEMLYRALVQQPLNPEQRARTGLFIGSSSFDITVSERRYRKELHAGMDAVPLPIIGYGKIAEQLQQQFALGPYLQTYSTACTSSANALLNAHRLLQLKIIDYALVVGVEVFNQTTLLGFHGLSLISPSRRMSPFEAHRDGLILGEGCGLVMLARGGEAPVRLCGGAIATDNFSLTAANADGSTVAAVVRMALSDCGLETQKLAGLKVHGTASLMNDEAEAAGICRLAAKLPPLFALKPYVGHTLGACGALETALTYGCLLRQQLPFDSAVASGEDLGINLLREPKAAPDGHYGLNFFAFGGNNTCLILHKGQA